MFATKHFADQLEKVIVLCNDRAHARSDRADKTVSQEYT